MLPLKDRYNNLESLAIWVGMEPTNLLYDKSKRESCVRLNSESGRNPCKLQPERPSELRDFKWAMESGMYPEKLV